MKSEETAATAILATELNASAVWAIGVATGKLVPVDDWSPMAVEVTCAGR